jgi:hypothetical protein
VIVSTGEIWGAILSAVGAGTALTTITTYLLSRKRDAAKERVSEGEQLAKHYKEMFEIFDKRIEQDRIIHHEQLDRDRNINEKRFERLEADAEKSRHGHMECERRTGKLEGRLEELSKIVQARSGTIPLSGDPAFTTETAKDVLVIDK